MICAYASQRLFYTSIRGCVSVLQIEKNKTMGLSIVMREHLEFFWPWLRQQHMTSDMVVH